MWYCIAIVFQYALYMYIHYIHVHLAIKIINAHCVITDFQISAPTNIRFPPDDITNQTFVVQWDAVTELAINYSVQWYEVVGDNETATVNEIATVNGTSYTVIGLTANTTYNVTVAAMYCGETGPVSNATIMTNMKAPTDPPTLSSPSATISTGNIVLYIHTCTIMSPR